MLNCMNSDGIRNGYDHEQLNTIREQIGIPLIASGGAGKMQDFEEVFCKTKVDGALAASVFHKNIILISELKTYLAKRDIPIRL